MATLGSAFAQPLTVAVAPLSPGEPVDGGRVLFVAPSPGAGAVATIAGPISIEGQIAGGVAATGQIVAGAVEGAYQVVAGTRGATGTALFSLQNNTPPSVLSVVDLGPDPAVPGTLRFQVTFSEGMTGGSPVNFSLAVSGLIGASISNVTGTGTTRTVTVLAGSGVGTLRLDLVNSTGLADQDGAGLVGLPAVGPTVTPVFVLGIDRLDANPTSSAEVAFGVTFSRPIDGLSAANFELMAAGPTGASIVGVTGGQASWTVRVATGTGTGTLGLRMVNTTGLTTDGPIANLPFVGQGYTIVLPLLRLAMTSVRQTGECLGPEERVAMETTITNGSAAKLVVALGLRLPAGLEKVPGSCSPGMIGCAGASANLEWSGEVAAGGTVRVVYQLRVSPAAPTGEPICLTAEATAGGVTTGSVPHCLTLTCPLPGPGTLPPSTRMGGAQFPGSVLLFNLYHSGASRLPGEESRIALTNTHPTSPVFVHLFFIDGVTGGVAQQSVSLSPNQTFSFLAGEVDPGVTGSLLAVAVDARGCPRRFNHLIGEVAVRFEGGASAHLGAIGVPALATGEMPCSADTSTVPLRFDGQMYAPFARALAVSGLGAPADGQRSWLVINRLGGALGEGGST